ncbi:type II toxin-antitoxin system YoeB family toxin [Nocardia beijingensis]|nr:type II toxin-antitoxin system YoeB family toxin [Nocardia beijingensis]MBF6075104.1 type II toxin-antitoxin system YoeB family toxin [Nocardia beijingensis]
MPVDLAGYWSRRFTQEHRLVYRVVDDAVWIAKVGKRYD